MEKKRWNSLTKPKKIAALVAVSVQLSLLAAAQVDMTRRSAAEINGSKLFWRLVVFINFLGPMAYFLFGRKRTAHPA
jgi:hypothetical protein